MRCIAVSSNGRWIATGSFDASLKVFGDKLKDHGETSGTELKCASHPQTLDLLSGTFVVDPYGDCKLNGTRTLGALNPNLAARYPVSNGGVLGGSGTATSSIVPGIGPRSIRSQRG